MTDVHPPDAAPDGSPQPFGAVPDFPPPTAPPVVLPPTGAPVQPPAAAETDAVALASPLLAPEHDDEDGPEPVGRREARPAPQPADPAGPVEDQAEVVGSTEPADADVRPTGVTTTDPAPSRQGAESRAARRRAAEEAARETSHRTHLRLAVAGIVALVTVGLLGVAWTWWSNRPASPDPVPRASSTAPVNTQPTLLLQVRGDDAVAVSSTLLSVGGPLGRATMIGIPQNTLVDVATGGTLPFGEVARLPGADTSADALSDAIGVDIDGTFILDRAAFSALVDAVGGVTADVDVNIVDEAADGTQTIVVAAGDDQLLQGPAAAAFATYLAEGETEEARIARFTQILRLTLAKLPEDPTSVETVLSQLGASAQPSVPFDQIAAFLVRLRADIVADDVVYKNLPVKPIDSGGPAANRVDNEAVAAMVADLLPEALRTPGPNSKVRVLVQNGVGSPGLNAQAREDLVGAGFTYVNGGNAAQFGTAATEVVVPDATAESLQWGADIAQALGVPASAVAVADSGQSVADVIVVLGADFKPSAG
ncbi:MAG: LytR C-terminal domain-containing protein [Actinobacteria bacterium]|nr:LytR C-terminal domain-containing protein [Actinomycetota bacterium]